MFRTESAEDVRVKYGTTVWNDSNVEWQEVEQLIIHENYTYSKNYDIGLIKLKNDIVYNEKIQPVELPTSDTVNENSTTVATGWGKLNVRKNYYALHYTDY